MNLTMQPDTELWELVQQDDRVAYARLFDRYWEEMFAMAYRRLADEAAAKDIVQNIFIHAWENRQQIVVSDTLRPYLFTALKYSVVRHLYRLAKQGTTALPLNIDNLPDEVADDRATMQEFDLLQQRVQGEIAAMPDRMREVFTLSYQQQLSIREIALQLSISEQTVKNQLHTALKRLRVRLQDQASFLPFIM